MIRKSTMHEIYSLMLLRKMQNSLMLRSFKGYFAIYYFPLVHIIEIIISPFHNLFFTVFKLSFYLSTSPFVLLHIYLQYNFKCISKILLLEMRNPKDRIACMVNIFLVYKQGEVFYFVFMCDL